MVGLPEQWVQEKRQVPVGEGVSAFQYGSLGDIAFRFDREGEFNKAKTQAVKKTGQRYNVHDDLVMLTFYVDRKSRAKHRISVNGELTKEGQHFLDIPKIRDEFERWQKGLSTTGTPLRKWDSISPAQILTLETDGIFTVEQFAECSKERVGNYPKSFHDLHDLALGFVAAKSGTVDVSKFSETLLEQQREIDRLKELLSGRVARSAAAEEKSVKSKGKGKGKVKQKLILADGEEMEVGGDE